MVLKMAVLFLETTVQFSYHLFSFSPFYRMSNSSGFLLHIRSFYLDLPFMSNTREELSV